MSQIYNSEVVAVGHFVPEKIMTNDDLSQFMDTSDAWIKERTGISERRIVASGVSTSDLGYKAALNAFERSDVKKEEIDLIIAATLSPDYYFPGIAVLIQNRLEIPCPAIDIRAQCSGFAWGLTMAHAMIGSGQYKNVLVVGSDIHSRLLEFTDRGRNVSVLFGDGAGAAVVSAKKSSEKALVTNKVSGIIDNYMGSDGSGAELLAITRPGMSGPEDFITKEEVEDRVYRPYMEGRKVFKNAVMRMSESITALLERNHLTVDDIDYLVPHQANIRIISTVADKFNFPMEKVVTNIHKYGNTTSASLPLCLSEAVADGRLKKGKLILTVVFGSGFTWGANLIRW